MHRVNTALFVLFFTLCIVFTATLTGSQETPLMGSGATGTPFINNNLNNVVATPFGVLPEPASVILLGIGILVVGYICRRGLRRR